MPLFRHILDRALAHVVRFSATPQHFEESVAEHSYFVAYFTAVLCRMLKEKEVEVDTEKAVTMALVHDAEEVFSGDILSPFKHYSPEVASAIRQVNSETIRKVFEDLPPGAKDSFVSLWKEEGEQGSLEAQVVKKADQLSLLSKCAEEVRAGNVFFEEMHDRQLENLRESKEEWWEKVKDEVLR